MGAADPELSLSAAHILNLLDSVEEQLATIRHWAELLSLKEQERKEEEGG